jgi:hypothetical protein
VLIRALRMARSNWPRLSVKSDKQIDVRVERHYRGHVALAQHPIHESAAHVLHRSSMNCSLPEVSRSNANVIGSVTSLEKKAIF